ncbi:unnamed protein product [Closterium sp. NIES-54]
MALVDDTKMYPNLGEKWREESEMDTDEDEADDEQEEEEDEEDEEEEEGEEEVDDKTEGTGKPDEAGEKRVFNVPTPAPGTWTPVTLGTPGGNSFRVTLIDDASNEVSPWHDVPLHSSNGTFNAVCLTPKGCQDDYEVAVRERLAPLRMRLRNNKPMRFADPIPWNFGVFPQTWADSSTRCPEFGNLPLDDSPVELIDIGSQVRQLGEAYAVEPLAAFVLVDPRGFQLSWKVVGIATDDPSGFQDLSDENVAGIVQTLLDCIRDWLRAGRHCGGETMAHCELRGRKGERKSGREFQ